MKPKILVTIRGGIPYFDTNMSMDIIVADFDVEGYFENEEELKCNVYRDDSKVHVGPFSNGVYTNPSESEEYAIKELKKLGE